MPTSLRGSRFGHLGAGLLLWIAAGGCHREPIAPQAPPPPAVTVSQPALRSMTDVHEYAGETEAMESVEVRARVRGFLRQIHFQEGAQVKAGDLLYEIDPRPFEAALARAKAEANRLEAQARLATSEQSRAAQLRSRNAITDEVFDERVATLQQAEASLQDARAAVQIAQLDVEFSQIHAPIAGRIGRTQVTQGNLVGYNEPTLLTTIVRMDPIYVLFDATERALLEYQRRIREEGAATATQGTVPVYVGLETDEGYPHQGVINFRDNRVDPNTGTVLIRAQVPNPSGIIFPGMYVRVRVAIGKPVERLLIPRVAVGADQQGEFVFVVQPDATAQQRRITSGQALGDFIVVQKGLDPNDWVVVNGVQKVRPGITVVAQRTSLALPDDASLAGLAVRER